MGRKRHTARTGDKALYKSRSSNNESKKKRNNEDDDPMYNEVDRYNNARDELQEDILRFDNDKKNDSSSDEEMLNEESVFDLGVGGSSSESEEDEEEDVEAMDPAETDNSSSGDDDDNDDEFSSSSDESETQAAQTDILDWGKAKKDYYHGDTADLEIGQETEDAELEEDAGKEVMKARMEGMSEDDFILETESLDGCDANADRKTKELGEEIEIHATGAGVKSKKRRNLAGLSKENKIKHMKRSHPELLPLISHFRDGVIRPCVRETLVVKHALFHDEKNIEAIGASHSGLQYILGKAMLQTSIALNVCQYLLLKVGHSNEDAIVDSSDDSDKIFGSNVEDKIRNHPVIGRLKQLNMLSDKIDHDVENNVKGLKHQIDTLMKISGMVTESRSSDNSKPHMNIRDESVGAKEAFNNITDKGEQDEDNNTTESSTDASSDEDEDPTAIQSRLMTEARFSVRSEDDEDTIELKNSVAPNRRHRALPSFSGCGDDDDVDNQRDAIVATRSLASTINSISQRSISEKGKRRPAPEMEDNAGDDEKMVRALDLMEADIGVEDISEGDEMDDAGLDYSQDEDEDNDFYSLIKKKSKQKKNYKQSKYAVAPKYPVLEEEVDAERPVGQMVMKNRGLVAHKAKINRNPRVKKREQYRKALIRRKGHVREVRTDEGHKYGGEATGIKSHLSRSRKLT